MRPEECQACGKALTKKSWYYRNGGYFCNKQCHVKKVEADKAKQLEEEQKAKEEAAGQES